jgi:hypothetical protein
MITQNYYLCSEAGEEFVLQADSKEQAQEDVSTYNGEVLRKIYVTKIEKNGKIHYN